MHRRRQRRFSLPEQSSPFFNMCKERVVPDGSDVYQKALEELYSSAEQDVTGVALGGLDNIAEGHESEEEEEDEDIPDPFLFDRRHSSPANVCLETSRSNEKLDDEGSGGKQDERNHELCLGMLLQNRNMTRREYFVKHGKWPSVKKPRTPVASPRPKTTTGHFRRGQFVTEVAFGSTVTKKVSVK